jgi:molecular chaperone GrpE
MQNLNRPSEAAEGEVIVAPSSAETEKLLEQVHHEHEMYLRALADFDNYRRRVERESERAVQQGKREIILSLLDVLDGFDLASEHMNDAPASLVDGVQAIYRKLQRVLEAQGVKPFDSRGQLFDPKLHEAIASLKTDIHPPGTVVDEVQRGYRWGDELLRPARVRVAA